MAGLDTILETTTAERPATGFVFTEGPLWHPDGYYYFADVRSSVFYRLRLGQAPETVRTGTGEGNGTTFDLQGRLVICEGGNRRVTRWSDESHTEVVMDRYEGKRINRPNDVVCKSDGSASSTSPIRATPSTSMRSSSTARATWCADAYSPTCRQRKPMGSPTA